MVDVTSDFLVDLRAELVRQLNNLGLHVPDGLRVDQVCQGFAAVERRLIAQRVTDGAILSDPLKGDGLLNDWGVHHLHLGRVETNGFAKRGDDLLFIYVRPDTLYMLDVLDHDSFEDDALLEIMHRNWPELIASRRLQLRGLLPELVAFRPKIEPRPSLQCPRHRRSFSVPFRARRSGSSGR